MEDKTHTGKEARSKDLQDLEEDIVIEERTAVAEI